MLEKLCAVLDLLCKLNSLCISCNVVNVAFIQDKNVEVSVGFSCWLLAPQFRMVMPQG
jgi:hypothetical protein